MPMFVDNAERVPVTIDGANTIFVRPKMDFGTQQKVFSSMARLSASGDGLDETNANIDMGAYQIALMVNNIVAWEGPSFRDEKGQPIPCTPAAIKRLDPDEPLVNKVLDEITKRNAPKSSPDPKAPTGATGSTTDGEPSSKES